MGWASLNGGPRHRHQFVSALVHSVREKETSPLRRGLEFPLSLPDLSGSALAPGSPLATLVAGLRRAVPSTSLDKAICDCEGMLTRGACVCQREYSGVASESCQRLHSY